MIARKKSREEQKAKSQKIQEQVHRILYCDTDWREQAIYTQRFRKIVERSDLNESSIEADADVARELRRRIEKKLKGLEPLDKSLVFYRIFDSLKSESKSKETLLSELNVYSVECVVLNLMYLQKSGLIELKGESYLLKQTIRKIM